MNAPQQLGGTTWPRSQAMGAPVKYASRGQALILAVLIMFILVGLGGLFVAIINSSLIQAARADDMTSLTQIAQAGMDHARNELRFSPDGAEWRPDPGPDVNNPYWINYGNGFYQLNVTYGPADTTAYQNPVGTGQYDNCIKITVNASLALPNPPDPSMDPQELPIYQKGFQNPRRYLKRNIIAYMPLGLTDNLFWLTNIDNKADPMVLGSAVSLTGPAKPNGTATDFKTVNSNPDNIDCSTSTYAATSIAAFLYPPLYVGPIFCQGDLQLSGFVHLTNGKTASDATTYTQKYSVLRNDTIQVTGTYSDYAGNSIVVNGMTLPAAATSLGADQHIMHLSGTPGPDPHYIRTSASDMTVQRLNPPRIDQRGVGYSASRYLTLTRDSGEWSNGVNTGAIGWGDGIYIDNSADHQFNGSQDDLRADWLDPTGSAGTASAAQVTYWNTSGNSRIYRPAKPITSATNPARAVVVVLRGWQYNGSGNVIDIPRLELHRYDNIPYTGIDGSTLTDNHRQDPDGDTYYWIQMPYPKNGIIYAEGNLIVKSEADPTEQLRETGLPASLAYADAAGHAPLLDASGAQRWGGWVDGGHTHYYVSDYNRRFDLSIVSGGTVYIESNLLSPSSRKDTYTDPTYTTASSPGKRPIVSGSQWDSKLALLAKDNVCLNPTPAFFADPFDNAKTPSAGNYLFSGGDSTDFAHFHTAGGINPGTRLLLRHGGSDNTQETAFNLQINTTPYPWSPPSGTTLYFGQTTNTPYCFGLLSALFPQSWPVVDATRFPTPAPFPDSPVNTVLKGYDAQNDIKLTCPNTSTANYALDAGSSTIGPGILMTGIDLQVDALIYAQQGSWYVIPGRYYNDNDAKWSDIAWPFPKNQEPMDVRIIVNGAIAENRPAPVEDEEEWTRHWRGANISYYTTNSTTPDLLDPGKATWDPDLQQWTNRRMGIEYHYDATLPRPVCYDTDATTNAISYQPRLPKLPVGDNVLSFGILPQGGSGS